MKTIIAALIVLLSASAASAEWGLYVSRNGKPWIMEHTYAFKDVVDNSCERSARELWRAEGQGKGNVTGVGCVEYSAVSYALPTPQATSHATVPSTYAVAPVDSGRGRVDSNVEYRQHLLDNAEASARLNSGGNQRVYTDGQSYNGREIQDAAAALSAAQQAAQKAGK